MNTIDPGVDLADAYRRGTDADQKFIANLAQFLGTFLKENSQLVEIFGDKTDELDLKNAHEMVNYIWISGLRKVWFLCSVFLRKTLSRTYL